MFCKWCGSNLNSNDVKCKRCGKEVQALSDCGGFYDLVPGAKNTIEIQQSLVAPHTSSTIVKREKHFKISLIYLLALTVALVISISLLFLVIALGKTSQPVSENDDISDSVIEEKTEIFCILVQGDDYEKRVIDDISINLSNKPSAIKLQYRFKDTSDWNDVSDDAFVQTDNEEKPSLIIKETWLQEVMKGHPKREQFELRCEITWFNLNGSSMSVTIEGIRFSSDENHED